MKKLIKGIVKDFKEDGKVLKDLASGNYKSKYTINDFKEGIKNFLKDPWTWTLLSFIILGFLVGWFIASQRYQDLANKFVLDYCSNAANDFLNNESISQTFKNFIQ